ncbi:MAG: serpin family protein [Actinomycetota bacterium]|nr:serpin family protein [Actinomycetota bacterium]
MRSRFLLLLLPAAALLVAACDGGKSQETSPSTTGPSTTPISGNVALTTPNTVDPGSSSRPSTTGQDPVDAVTRAPIDRNAPADALAAGFNEAGFDLLRTQPDDENVVFSPSSIGHALLMASAAADSDTADAIDEALGLPRGSHDAWNALDQRMAAAQGEDLTITIADRIWPRLGAEPDPAWLGLLAAQHGAGTEPLDLAGDPDASRQRINGWVDEQTKGLIPDLLPEDFIDPNTVLVLTDTLYFEARWEMPFGKYGPLDGSFTRLDGSTVDVELMQELELVDRRGEGDGFVGAEIPYVGDEFSMLVIVPDEGRFAEIRDGLDQAFLDQIDDTFSTGLYELRLPSWKTETQIDLLAWLTEIGAAPGSYPAIAPDAFLDAAVHGANISVDEWGTVAAAATALGFEESGAPAPELVVAADQPFLYLIRHRESGLVLFTGQVTDPMA